MRSNEPVTHFVNFAPTGINRWSSNREAGSPQRMSIFFRQASDTNRPFRPPEAGVAELSLILRRRGAFSKKSRSCLIVKSPGAI